MTAIDPFLVDVESLRHSCGFGSVIGTVATLTGAIFRVSRRNLIGYSRFSGVFNFVKFV